jgi:hypothetical protein
VRRHAGAASAGSIDRRDRHFGAGVLATLALSAALLLGVGAPVASAAPEAGPGWAFKANFGSFETFEAPRTPVAVDGSGNIFTTNENQGIISVFSPSPDGGTLLTEFSTVNSSLRNIAVDPGDSTVYADGVFGEPIRRYVSDGAPTPTYTLDPGFAEAPQGEGIAVDPTTGDLLVADPGAEGVRRYDTSGTLLETIATPSINPAWIVAAPDGSFYVAPVEGPDVTHFSGTGTQLGTISGVGSLHGLSYDASRSVVVVAVGESLRSYSPAGALLAESPANGGSGRGLAVSASGSLYENVGGSLNFYVPGTVPGVEAPHVSDIVAPSAHVSAEVDPGAGPPEGSVAHFEYSADGGENWTSTPDVSVERTGSEEPDTVEADLTGLKPNTDYLVRLVAGNSVITTTSGSTTFKSAAVSPTAVTEAATSTVGTSATLNGSVNPNGAATTFFFEYGPTAAYGTRIPVTPIFVGEGFEKRRLSRSIGGLVPGATYHFRIVAENVAGTAEGDDQTFVAGSGLSEGRVYEQVTPVNKDGSIVDGRYTILPLSDGSGVAYSLRGASSEAEGNPVENRYVSLRGSTDWNKWLAADPPTTVNGIGPTFYSTIATSDDGKFALVASNRVLTPDAEGEYTTGHLYRKNLATKQYELVGTAPAFNEFATLGRGGLLQGGNRDLSDFFFTSGSPLLDEAVGKGRQIYRWSPSGGLELVSLLPDDSVPAEVAAPNISARAYIRYSSQNLGRFFFTVPGEGVFMREGEDTTPVSVSKVDGTLKPASFGGTDASGRYAFFVSGGEMLEGVPPCSPCLYRADTVTGDLELVSEVSSQMPNYPGEVVAGVTPDGNTVYFSAPNSEFLAWHAGTLKVLSIIPPGADTTPFVVSISPNGRYMAYNPQGVVGSGVGEVYLYDAQTEEQVCVSCLAGEPTNEALLPWSVNEFNNAHGEVVTNEGEVYFSTSAALLPNDTNGTSDVYGYRAGELSLISPGNAPVAAYIGGIAADGRDVFFGTAQGLVPQDTDGQVDIYDARVGGGFSSQQVVPRQGCDGEACQPPAAGGPAALSIGSDQPVGTPIRHKQKHSKKHKKCSRAKHKSKCVRKKKNDAKHDPRRAR